MPPSKPTVPGVALACVVAAGCGPSHWIGYACEVSIAPHRDAVAYHDNDAHRLVLRRDDGDHPLAYPRCVGSGDDIAGVLALADGWRALVYGYGVTAGNGFESGELKDEFACIVDFRTGATTDVNPLLLSYNLRQFQPTVGASTGWIYNHEVANDVVVIDLAKGVEAKLENAGGTIVELGTTARTVRAQPIDSGSLAPDHKGAVTVQDYDTTTWPPAPREPRLIPVRGRSYEVVVSTDGRWAAYYGSVAGDVYDLGLVDLEAGTLAFEQLQQPGDGKVRDVLVAGDAVWLLTAVTAPALRDRVYTLQWLDRNGAAVGPAKESRDDFAPALTWMPGRRRVASKASCAVDLLDLPPPVK
jgi:hypothetical protein